MHLKEERPSPVTTVYRETMDDCPHDHDHDPVIDDLYAMVMALLKRDGHGHDDVEFVMFTDYMDPACMYTFHPFRCSMDEFRRVAEGAPARLCELSCYFTVVGKGPWWLDVVSASERFGVGDVGVGKDWMRMSSRRMNIKPRERSASPRRVTLRKILNNRMLTREQVTDEDDIMYEEEGEEDVCL